MPKTYYLFLLLLAIGCKGKENPTSEQPISPPATTAQVVGIGRVEAPGGLRNLGSEQGGLVAQLLVNAGDSVRKGQVLALLSQGVEAQELLAAQQQQQTQQRQVDLRQAALQQARQRLAYAQQQQQRAQQLLTRQAETPERAEAADNELKLARMAVTQAEAELQLARQQVSQQQEEVQRRRLLLEERVLRAPADGQVLELLVDEGEFLPAGGQLAVFAGTGPLLVRTEVDELFAQQIAVGDRAEIRLLGTTEPIAKGSVVQASPYLKKKSLFSEKADDREDRRVREVQVRLQEGKRPLYNSRVECVIYPTRP